METITYVIIGEPIALARPRHGRNNQIYDSQRNEKLVNGITLLSQHKDNPMYTGPIHLDVTFFMTIYPRAKRKSGFHMYTPDLDNMIKWVCDISNSILFDDDCIVAKITASKVYDPKPRTEFTLKALE